MPHRIIGRVYNIQYDLNNGVSNTQGNSKAVHNTGSSCWIPLEFLSFQPLQCDCKGLLSRINRLVAEIPRRFIVDKGMILAEAIDREPVEIGLRAEFLGKPRQRIRQAVRNRPPGYGYAQSFQEGVHKIEKVPGVMIGDEINLPRHR